MELYKRERPPDFGLACRSCHHSGVLSLYKVLFVTNEMRHALSLAGSRPVGTRSHVDAQSVRLIPYNPHHLSAGVPVFLPSGPGRSVTVSPNGCRQAQSAAARSGAGQDCIAFMPLIVHVFMFATFRRGW